MHDQRQVIISQDKQLLLRKFQRAEDHYMVKAWSPSYIVRTRHILILLFVGRRL